MSHDPVGGHSRRYGLLLPHFGPHASRDALTSDVVRIEALGFDSVWARDHVVYEPHRYEDQDRTFLDPLITLSVVAGVTERLILATGCLIPHRHPVSAAAALAALDFAAGGNRVLVGFGLGTFDHEFDSVGMAGWDRRRVLPEQVQIMKRLWSGEENVAHHGEFYDFEGVTIRPVPEAGTLPIWYSGPSQAAVRRAVEGCDGWVAGALPRELYAKRIRYMERLTQESGRDRLPIGCMPIVSPGRTVEEALAPVNLDRLLAQATDRYAPPEPYRNLDDLDGSVIAGPPDRIVEEVLGYHRVGVSHVVFDLRLRYDDWTECTELLAGEVLPKLKKFAQAEKDVDR